MSSKCWNPHTVFKQNHESVFYSTSSTVMYIIIKFTECTSNVFTIANLVLFIYYPHKVGKYAHKVKSPHFVV